MIKGKNYKERCSFQLDEWVRGNPIHNNVDNECCPDFSCCMPKLLQPLDIRETFKAISVAADSEPFNPDYHPAYDAYIGMLYGFIDSCINEATDKNIHVIDGNTEFIKDLN